MTKSPNAVTKYSLILLIVIIIILSGLLITSPTFNKNKASIATVDLDKVATAIGRTDVLSTTINKSSLAEYESREKNKEEILTKIKKMKKEMGTNPTKEQAADYKKIMREANFKYYPTSETTKIMTEESKVKSVRQFREKLIPIIKQVAKEKNLYLVEIKSPNTIYINSKIDISDDLIDKLLQQKTINN